MALSLPFTIRDIADELGIGGPIDVIPDISGATTNDCSPSSPDQTAPFDLDSWDGYDHTAGPPKPTNFTGNPGSDASPIGEPTQDSHVFMSIPIQIVCADVYDVARAATSGGAKTIIGPDQVGIDFVYNHGTADSPAGFFYLRAVGTTGIHGPWADELELRTAPRRPQGVITSDNFDCDGIVITVTWNNGTAPGLRDSIVKWRWRLNGGSWSAIFSTSSGATQFQLSGGAINDQDQFDFELYYDEETLFSAVSKSRTVTCPI